MIDRNANQFQGIQCRGSVCVFWHGVGPPALHGWWWRPTRGGRGFGPFDTSCEALLAAIRAGHGK